MGEPSIYKNLNPKVGKGLSHPCHKIGGVLGIAFCLIVPFSKL